MALFSFHFLSHRLKALFDDPCILNWNPIQKSVLVFLLFIQIKILWIIWKTYIFLTPKVQIFVHLSEVKFQLYIELIEIFFAVMFAVGLLLISNSKKGEVVLPYLSVNIFGLSLLFDAYMAGLFGPNTMVNTACYLFIGFMLFSVRVMLSVIASVAITFAVIGNQIINGNLVHAPLFNFDTIGTPVYVNGFWMGSIAYFTFPILIICISLLILILKQWRERENYIAYLGHLDPLTGIYNRRMLNQELAYLDQNKSQSLHAIFMLDLDHFKQINDRYGHMVGDQVLGKVAGILKENIRNSDILGRYGGEEFLILLKNINVEKAKEVAERCRAALNDLDHPIKPDQVIKVSGSIGVSFITDGEDAMHALNAADEALYKAKALGRNRICYADSK